MKSGYSARRMSRIHWSRDWQEVFGDDEAARFETFARDIGAIAREVAARTHQPVGRVFHLKKHTGVVATLKVREDLPEPLGNGVFANGGAEYPCYLRFSNGAVRKQLDGVLDVRGVGLKLVGVAGGRLGGGDDVTQDFLFVQTPAVPTDSFDEFLALARASVGGPLLLPVKLALAVGLPAAVRILLRLVAMKQPQSLVGATFYNAVPVMLGPAAMKLSLAPRHRAEERRGETLRDDLVSRVKEQPLTWTLRAQLYTDERRTPIESASRVWDGAWHDVADLTVPKQDVESASGRAIDDVVDGLAFNPWHGVVDHRPRGATQRARAAAYRVSTAQRGAQPEPRSVVGG